MTAQESAVAAACGSTSCSECWISRRPRSGGRSAEFDLGYLEPRIAALVRQEIASRWSAWKPRW